MDEIARAYRARTGVEVRVTYGASNALARQIENGAPADVIVSADSDWMDYLSGKRLVVAASRRNLVTNHLALVAPAASRLSLKVGPNMPLAQALGEGRLAMAGPDVPAGRYARASLKALRVWDSVQARVVSAETVRAALLYVSRGEAPLGIVYDTDARAEPAVRIIGLFPDASHPQIVYPGALVAASSHPGAARFLGELQGPEAASLFRKYGFMVLPRPN
jgi:molybdate transport system substrate-binding protein